MDANMCRLPEDTETLTEFLASLSDGMLYPQQTDRAGIRSKQRKGQPDSKKNNALWRNEPMHISNANRKKRISYSVPPTGTHP